MTSKTLFENTEVAFQLKSDSQLERAYFLFKMINNEPLVKIGTTLTKAALGMGLPVEGLIRSTVFDHFCGGVNEEDCMQVIDKMYEKGVYSVLDYSVEGKAEEVVFEATTQRVLQLIDFAKNNPALSFAVFKPTGFGRFEIYRKITENQPLTESEQKEWENIQERFNRVSKKCHDNQISLLIDAEESWMQDAADQLTESLMERFNKETPIVWNTLQCYRHDRLDYLKKIHQRARQKGYKLGFKIVRGAYLEKENERAKEKGYPSPICRDKQTTDENFNQVLRYIIDHIEEIHLFTGTHNEVSTYLAMQLMEEKQLSTQDKRIWFGQLYGMSDHITFNLAHAGYNTAKYLPFGPVKDVMPYLIRRAEENTSVAGQTSRELNLLKTEKRRRGI